MRFAMLAAVFGCLVNCRAEAGSSYVLPDGVNRAPAVTLHCITANGGATPCGVASQPLYMTATGGAASATNQTTEIGLEQGFSQALGTQADTAYAGGNGSVVSLLKGVAGTLSAGTTALPAGGQPVSRTLSVPAQQSVTLFPVNPNRKYLAFQVPTSTSIWVNLIGGIAAPNGADCAYFASGTFYESGQYVNRGAITFYAPVAVTISAWEG